jgi:PhzF family phenazine biosynthesis protein
MGTPLWIVDAFTHQPFSGNPAAVCLLTQEADSVWMQKLAGEMNLSETAFVWPEANGYRLRWMTPKCEVDLCGHATLAAAYVLWETETALPASPITFHTRSGALTASPDDGWIVLDFPALPSTPQTPPDVLSEALGVHPVWAGTYGMDWLLELENETEAAQLRPNFTLLKQAGLRGCAVTAPSSNPEYDFVSRFFAPSAGVDEDPVTGSMHCGLAPYWAAKLGRPTVTGRQISARGGTVRCSVVGLRVLLKGRAAAVVQGRLAAGAMP